MPATSGRISSNFSAAPSSFSLAINRSTPAFVSTRSVLRNPRIIRRVSNSDASTKACLTFGWTGASLVAINRVPIFIPSAPIARAATRLRPSAMPPEATNGICNSSAARGRRMKLGTSSSPGWPPHSKPSTDTASQPIFSAFKACRTEVHL